MLNELASSVSFFGLFLTCFVFVGISWLCKKTKISFINPLFISCAVIIVFLLVTGIDSQVFIHGKKTDYGYDGTGAAFLQVLLTPTTVCLAIPLYEKLAYLKKYPLAIIAGILSGAITSLGTVLGVAAMFGLSYEQLVTFLPKSITTAIGIDICAELGGIPSLTAAIIALTGMFGNATAAVVMKLFKIKHPVSVGLACGTAAHAIGTAKARDFGEIEEAMSGLSIAVCGLITVILAPMVAAIPI